MKPEDLLTQKINDYSTIYIDMDSFFASVEQFYNPDLRYKPVGIATGTTKNASIIAASYQAKQKGIYTGIKIEQALLCCPEIKIIYDSPNSYRAVHKQIMTILNNTICRVYAKGIDEAYLKVPSYSRSKGEVFTLVKAIKSDLRNLYNEYIDCSIGVASNIWLAKMAASYQKPRGFFILKNNNLIKFYKNLNLIQLNGIGLKMIKRLNKASIYTPTDMYYTSWSKFSRLLGINGQKWYLRMRGVEVDNSILKPQKTLGHQVTLGQNKPTTYVEITTVVLKICEVLGKRLRKEKLKAQAVYIILYFENYETWSNKIEKVQLFNDIESIFRICKMLLKKLKIVKPLKKISITLGSLIHSNQISWYEKVDYNHSNQDSVSYGLDYLYAKYDNSISVTRAHSFFENSFNLNRVGFAGDIIRESTLQNK